MGESAEYKLYAFEAQRMAEMTRNPTEQACWQAMANKWRALAEPRNHVIARTYQMQATNNHAGVLAH